MRIEGRRGLKMKQTSIMEVELLLVNEVTKVSGVFRGIYNVMR